MTMGAGIFCVVCGARPYPQLGPPETREDFDLMRLNRKGRPAESPASGQWFCSRHFERMGRDYQVTAEWIWANEEPGGPSWDDFDRCRALCCVLTKSIKPATVAGVEGKTDQAASAPPFWENPPEPDAPPPTGDDPSRSFEDLDKIPF